MELHTIGGFNEVGKNMTVLNLGEDAVMFDSGLFMPAIVELQEQENSQNTNNEKKLRSIGALPDDLLLDRLGLRNKIRAILVGHAHLDHVGALPYSAYRYDAPIVGTPFTLQVLKRLIEDGSHNVPNKLSPVNPNGTFRIKGKNTTYDAEFINITHSTIQTSMIAVHTKDGVILYANDFKIDDNPIVGLPPNYAALRSVAKEGVKALVVDSLYSGDDRKTSSEKIARAMLEEVMLTVNNRNSAVVVTTFSSHIARLKSIVDFAKRMNREVYFVGRSLSKYVSAAKDVGQCPFAKDIQIASYKNQVTSILKKVDKDRANSVLVCTGHQGEPGSILDRLAREKLPFTFRPNDNVIFSSKTIPAQINLLNKSNLDKKLKKAGVRLFDNVHVSGHAGREDLRDLIALVNPENIIPAHGSTQQLTPMVELANELGYRTGKEIHLMHDGQKLKL